MKKNLQKARVGLVCALAVLLAFTMYSSVFAAQAYGAPATDNEQYYQARAGLAFVGTELELRDALANKDIDTIVFTGDITVTRTDLKINTKRTQPTLVIDGLYSRLTELKTDVRTPAKAIRIESKGTLASLDIRNLTIDGGNPAGSIYVADLVKLDITYSNVTYQGPQLVEAPSATVRLYNVNAFILSQYQLGVGKSKYAGEAVEANRIILAGDTYIEKVGDFDGANEAIFYLRKSNSMLASEQGASARVYSNPGEEEQKNGKYKYVPAPAFMNASHASDIVVDNGSYLTFNTGSTKELQKGILPRSLTIGEDADFDIHMYLDDEVYKGFPARAFTVDGNMFIDDDGAMEMVAQDNYNSTPYVQCLLYVDGALTLDFYSRLNIHAICNTVASPAYPLLYLRGGKSYPLTFNEAKELSVSSENTANKDWARAIGFASEGYINADIRGVSVRQKTGAVQGKQALSEYVGYYSGSDDLFRLNLVVKPGANGVTKSVAYTPLEGYAPLRRYGDSGSSDDFTLTPTNFNMKSFTEFHLYGF
jgi:hypothetical protein